MDVEPASERSYATVSANPRQSVLLSVSQPNKLKNYDCVLYACSKTAFALEPYVNHEHTGSSSRIYK